MPAVTAVIAVGAGVLGLLVGSFLNVVIHRLPRRESVVRPRSRCPRCGKVLAARDNLPVLSWLALGGRCRSCREPIAWRYPVIELLTAGAFAAVGARFGPDVVAPAFLSLTAVLIAVSAIDIEHFIVPNRALLAGTALGVPLLVIATFGEHDIGDLVGAGLGGLLGGGALLLIALLYPRGMGMGDVKLAAYECLFLGFLSVGHVAVGLFLGFLAGSVGGILLIGTKVRTRKDHIPFAPFLAAGGFLSVLFGRTLLEWYQR